LPLLLHNLGEALRRDGQYSEAITTLREAESLARSADDFELAISAVHSAGLSFQDRDEYQIASEHFQKCRNEARQKGIWTEYVRAWEAMANLAHCQAKVNVAVSRYKRALSEATRHGCKDSENRIALNYANLLCWEGSARKAKQLLNLHCKDYAERTGAYFYHFLQASTSEALDDYESAESHWRCGLTAAQIAGEQVYIAICAAGLADVFATKALYADAEKYYQVALDHEEIPEDRAILLRQLLEVLLSADKEKASTKVFEEAIEIATANHLDEAFIDLYMSVFDHNWRCGPKSQLEALKAFVCAFGKAITLGVDHLMKVKAHVVMTLTAENLAPSEEHLEQLQKELAIWIQSQFPRQRMIHELILFPLSMAKRMLPYAGNPRKLEAAAAKELPEFRAVLKAALNWGNSGRKL
jgi:tetratricopeptide (TPR) repeat protein